MSVYAVGDIQGCYRELMELLERVEFNPRRDKLWVVGDIVNRGPDSKSALRFLFDNRKSVVNVLGNHDLHMLAIYFCKRKARSSDKLEPVFKARACDDWMQWLRHSPLLHHDKALDYTMVHAGIAPQWTLRKARSLAAEVEKALQGKAFTTFLKSMYGNDPARWDNRLRGYDRLRCITNYFTRMRLVSRNGSLEFSYKGDARFSPKGYYPWFAHPHRKTALQRIVFGHWAALGGYIDAFNFGIDTGCVWGRHLTLLDLQTHELHLAQAVNNRR